MDWIHCQDVVLPCQLEESYVKGESKVPLYKHSIGESLKIAAEKKPDHVAVIYAEGDVHVTCIQLFQEVNILAKGLLGLGVTKGDVILVSGDHGENFATLLYAITSIGAIFFMPYIYEPKHYHLKTMINKINVKMLITNERDSSMIDALKKIDPDAVVKSGHVNRWVNVSEFPSLKAIVVGDDKGMMGILPNPMISDEQLIETQSMVTSDDPGFVFLSTGTTGEPKAILSHQSSMMNEIYLTLCRTNRHGKDMILAVENPTCEDVFCIEAILAAVIVSEFTDITCVITPDHVPRAGFSDVIVGAMETYGVTHAHIWPYVWRDIILYGTKNGSILAKLKGGITSSQPLAVDTVKEFISLAPEFVNFYSTSEAVTTTSNFVDDPVVNRRLESVGFPLAHVEIKLIDDQDNVVRIGKIGEVCVKTPLMFLEYVGESEKTRSVKDERGWYRTGDVGRLDQNGFLYLVGRKADSIRFKRLGDIIYPGVIEAAAMRHKKVAEAKCLGINNAETCLGDDICLCIVVKPGESIKQEEIDAHCGQFLTERDQPDHFLIMEDFPRVGARKKISKDKLREMCQKAIIKGN